MKTALPMMWDAAECAFRPTESFRHLCLGRYHAREVVVLSEARARSTLSHRHYFTCVREAWANLPEAYAPQFPTEEHLRKSALIRAGFFDSHSIVCATKAEAKRVAAYIRPIDGYSVVNVEGRVVTRYVAKSQSDDAMEPAEFQRSKEAVLGILADMIGVDPAELLAAGRKAAA